MMRKCHLNTCPVGVATQDPVLRKKFAGKPEHVVNYLFMVAEDARQIMAELGFRTIDEMVGRVDCLETNAAIQHWKADGLDLTELLTPIEKPHAGRRHLLHAQAGPRPRAVARPHEAARPGASRRSKTASRSARSCEIINTNRTVGTILSHEIAKRWGEELLPDGTIHFKLTGSAGQSFGAFLAKGVTLELVATRTTTSAKASPAAASSSTRRPTSSFVPEDNIIIGNVALYGATSGEAFFRGRAAERFAVRNSGAHAVIEGVGDHGCEYMTGGRVVILGPTGRNFAAGMSGGIAYVWDPHDEFLAELQPGHGRAGKSRSRRRRRRAARADRKAPRTTPARPSPPTSSPAGTKCCRSSSKSCRPTTSACWKNRKPSGSCRPSRPRCKCNVTKDAMSRNAANDAISWPFETDAWDLNEMLREGDDDCSHRRPLGIGLRAGTHSASDQFVRSSQDEC